MISYSKQTISRADINEVIKVLKSDWLTTGPWVTRFEHKIKKYVKAKYAVAVNSGTAALHAACFAARITPGDEVITTPYSFAATANCVLYCNAKPVFVDINPNTFNIDTKLIEDKITTHTKAIIAVDFGGNPCNWIELKKIAEKYNLWLIDDAAHSFGAKYNGKTIGTQAKLTCFSFHPVKTITTGEGGMVVTDNRKLYERMLTFRTHGIIRKDSPPWFYQMKYLGFNYRLTDIQAALGMSQMKKATKFLLARRKLAKRYHEKLSGLTEIKLPFEPADNQPSWHLYPVRIDFNTLGKSREKLFAEMNQSGIKLQVHYIPIHFHPYYRKMFGYKQGNFPVSEKVYSQEVSLPLYPNLTDKQQDKVIKILKHFLLDAN